MTEFTERLGHAGADLARLGDHFSGLGDQFRRDLAEPVVQASAELQDVFERTFDHFETALKRAAETGKLSFREMVNSILEDMSRLAFDRFVAKPLRGFLEQVVGQIFNFGGARAIGGPVAPGHSYLVGERGPELFVPNALGRIDPMRQRGRENISIQISSPDVEGFRRSQQQISAMLTRAVRRGSRTL